MAAESEKNDTMYNNWPIDFLHLWILIYNFRYLFIEIDYFNYDFDIWASLILQNVSIYIFQFSRIILRREDGEQHMSFGLFRFGSNIELNEHFKYLKTFIKYFCKFNDAPTYITKQKNEKPHITHILLC